LLEKTKKKEMIVIFAAPFFVKPAIIALSILIGLVVARMTQASLEQYIDNNEEDDDDYWARQRPEYPRERSRESRYEGDEPVYTVVEEMPRFPTCEYMDSIRERKKCADQRFLEFLYDNLQYPVNAERNLTEGTVKVSFVVERDGTCSNIRLHKDIGDKCGLEGLRLIHLMNSKGIRWIPGKKDGEVVRVQITVPIIFSLV
jgi:hypothetical protein